MSLLIYSPQCNHSLDIIDYISKNEQLKSIVSYHNINERGIPCLLYTSPSPRD